MDSQEIAFSLGHQLKPQVQSKTMEAFSEQPPAQLSRDRDKISWGVSPEKHTEMNHKHQLHVQENICKGWASHSSSHSACCGAVGESTYAEGEMTILQPNTHLSLSTIKAAAFGFGFDGFDS